MRVVVLLREMLAYLVCVRSQWDTESSCETKISQLQVAVSINQQVLWLQVSVQHPVTVTISNSLNQLCHELLDDGFAHAQRVQMLTAALR